MIPHACLWSALLAALLSVVAPAAAQEVDEAFSGSPLDQLRPEAISEIERRVATERNGGTLPEGLVAILGDSRWQHTPKVRDIALLPDGKSCVTAGGTTLIVWDLHTGEARSIMPCDPAEEIVSLALGADGRTLAAGDSGGDATIWDLPEGRLRHELALKGSAVAISRDGRHFVTGARGWGTSASGTLGPDRLFSRHRLILQRSPR